jgi:DNA-binding GntR family transcriptional regulator
MIFKTIDRETSLHIVLEGIRSAILNNSFQPGSQLKQSIIAAEFGVSQGLVREALAQ